MDSTFDFTKDFLLQDDVAMLRPLVFDDIAHLEPFSHETEIWKFSAISGIGRENLLKYIDNAVSNRTANIQYPFIVFDKRTSRYAGSTRFYDIQPENKTLQLGYTWYGQDFHGTGLNNHCKLLLLTFAFEELGMERVEFRANNENKRSIAAMQKIGCTIEGILRSNIQNADGTRRDSIILSILKDEWFSEIKQKLRSQLQSETWK